jgi:tetratricopeptide (TPR) repeat protein
LAAIFRPERFPEVHVMSASNVSKGVAVVLAASLAAAGCRKNPDFAKQEYLKSGNRYMESGKVAEAIVQYRNAVQQDPRFGEARLKLAEAYIRNGDVVRSYAEFVRAADLMPNDPKVQVQAGTLLLLRGRFEDAKTRARKALAKDPKNVQATLLLGNALAGLKDFEGAVRELEEAAQLDPNGAAAYTSLGMVHLQQENKPEAEAAFRRAVEIAPNNPATHLALAQYLLGTPGALKEVEVELLKAHEVDQKNALAIRSLAAFYTALNRPADSEKYLKLLVANDTSAGRASSLTLAEFYISSRRYDEAISVLKPLLDRREVASGARTRIAFAEFAQNKKADAYRDIDSVLKREPRNAMALITKGRFLVADKKLTEALNYAKQAAAADPGSARAHYLAGSVHAALGHRDEATAAFNEVIRLNPRAAAAQTQLARLSLQRGDPNTAMDLAKSAVRNAPNSPEAHQALVRALLAKHDFAQADVTLKPLEKAFPNAVPVLVSRGTVDLFLQRLPSARTAFDRAAALDPGNAEVLRGQIALDLAMKKPDEARKRAEAWVEKNPTNSNGLLALAQVYGAQHDVAKLEATLKRIIQQNPAELTAYTMLGRAYIAQNRLDDARKQFEDVVAKQPKALGAATMIGMIYEMQGLKSEARRQYEKVVHQDATAGVASNNLAWMYVEDGGNLDLALQLAQNAKSRLPNRPEVNDTLGWVYYKKDLATLALPALREAVDKDPSNPTYQYHLGLAYAKTGDRRKAKEALQRALAIKADFSGAEDAKKVLETL